MKSCERSLLKWASHVLKETEHQSELDSLQCILQPQVLVGILGEVQPDYFSDFIERHDLDRASNSLNFIIKEISQFYRTQLSSDISPIVEGMNAYKDCLPLWELLIGIAVKGSNRDSNINVILEMDLSVQSELMLMVEEVIQKLAEYQNASDKGPEGDSCSEVSNRRRTDSVYSHRKNEFLNELLEENETLKERNADLSSELVTLKASSDQAHKNYEEKIQFLKKERYQFVDVLAHSNEIKSIHSGSSAVFKMRDSVASNESGHSELFVSITGSLSEIATELLDTIKEHKFEIRKLAEKNSFLEDCQKDLNITLSRMTEESKVIRVQLTQAELAKRDLERLKQENREMLKNQAELISNISELQQQKQYLRDHIEKLNQEGRRNQGSKNQKAHQRDADRSSISTNNLLMAQGLDMARAPSMIMRQISSSQIEPQDGSSLNQQIDDIKSPLLRSQYEKQISELRQKIDLLKVQNKELKHINNLMQRTIHKSLEASIGVQEGMKADIEELFLEQQKYSHPQVENDQTQKKQNSSQNSGLTKLSRGQIENKEQNREKMSKLYRKIKSIISGYQNKELLLQLEVQSLKKQLQIITAEQTIDIEKNKQSEKKKNEMERKQDKKPQKLESSVPTSAMPLQKRDKPSVSQEKQSEEQKNKKSIIEFGIQIHSPQETQTINTDQVPTSEVYNVRRSEVNDSFKIPDSKEVSQGQVPSFSKKDSIPSYKEIEQGDDINQVELSRPKMNSRDSDKSIGMNDILGDVFNRNFAKEEGDLQTLQAQSPHNQLGTSCLKRQDFSNKSQFFNSSFIELSSKLHEQIVTEVDHVKNGVKNFSNRISALSSEEGQTSAQIDLSSEHDLLAKLKAIEQGYKTMSKCYRQNIESLDSEALKLRQLEKSENIRLTLENQSLKKTMTQMVSNDKIKMLLLTQLKQTVRHQYEGSFIQNSDLQLAINRVLSKIQEVSLLVPEMCKYFEQNPSVAFQKLYRQQQQKNDQLNHQINVLMETVVFMRNIVYEDLQS